MPLITRCLALLLPNSQQPLLATRRSVLHGAVATFALPLAANAADVTLGSAGISSYEKLKLDTATSELAEAIVASKSSVLKPSLDAYAEALKLISESSATKDTAAKLDAASALLQQSATGGTEKESLLARAAEIEKLSRSTAAACGKPDVGPAAVAASKLADELTDFAYGWTAAVRPLQEVTIGQPDLKPAGGYVENFSGLGTKKGGQL